MKKLSLFLVAVYISTAAIGFAEDVPISMPSGGSNDPVVVSLKMTISNEKPDPSLLIREKDLLDPSFRNADPEIPFPSRARLDKVYDGRAAVGVMLDAEGNATDFLIVRYSKLYFAEALLNTIRHEEFMPRRVKADPVPGRFYVIRTFSLGERDPADENRPRAVSMNPMEQMGAMSNRVSDSQNGPKLIYKARDEREIDGHTLKIVTADTPTLPAGYEVQPKQVLKVIVSFYVDEKGNVRLPNVDSNSPALIVPSVIKAVSGWKFAPPTIKGKPVLAFTSRTLSLEATTPPNNTAEPKTASADGK
jgi:hypothetical protein